MEPSPCRGMRRRGVYVAFVPKVWSWAHVQGGLQVANISEVLYFLLEIFLMNCFCQHFHNYFLKNICLVSNTAKNQSHQFIFQNLFVISILFFFSPIVKLCIICVQ